MKIIMKLIVVAVSGCAFACLVPACSTGKYFMSSSNTWMSEKGESSMTHKDLSQFMSQLRPHEGNAGAHYQLGCWYHERSRDQEAIKEFQKAIYVKPDYVEAYNGLGVCFDRQGDYAAASDAYRIALKLNPKLGYIYSNLGHSYILQGKNEEAIDALTQALALGSNSKQTHNNLGLAYALSGQPDLAMKEFEQIGSKALAQALVAKIYYRKGEFEKAREHYSKALELDPDSAPLQQSLETSTVLSKFEAALAPLKKVVHMVVPGESGQTETGDAPKRLTNIGMEVSNGNGVNEMAKNMGRYLKEKGFRIVRRTNADHFGYQNTTLLYKPEFSKASREVAAQLPEIPAMKEVKNLDRPAIGIKIVLGKDLIAHKRAFVEEKK